MAVVVPKPFGCMGLLNLDGRIFLLVFHVDTEASTVLDEFSRAYPDSLNILSGR